MMCPLWDPVCDTASPMKYSCQKRLTMNLTTPLRQIFYLQEAQGIGKQIRYHPKEAMTNLKCLRYSAGQLNQSV